MAQIEVINPTTIQITTTLDDARSMIRDAAEHLEQFADEIVTICDKMPEFDYTYFCFYAYDSARLFERMLGIDPKQYLSFSMDAPDSFFYALYGGMSGLYGLARSYLTAEAGVEGEQ